MDSTPNRSILQDKTNLISETTHIKQSGKGSRTPVEKVSGVLSPTSKNLEKSVSKQTLSSDSCSFNSALQSSDTDATATADYDSAGESEFVLAPETSEQNLNLTLLANSLDGLHIATPPHNNSHSPHDCSLFAVKFTKSDSPLQEQEELSSEANSSIVDVDSDQENDGSLSGILNLSNVSVEEITVARTTPLEFLASVENFENRRLSAARSLAASRSSDQVESNENNTTGEDAFSLVESQLQVENHFNDTTLPENSRSFSGIPNLSNVSYEEISITGITPFGFIATAENFENSQVSATNATATVETKEDLIENKSQVEESSIEPRPLGSTAENTVACDNQTSNNVFDGKDLIENKSLVKEAPSKEFHSPLENSVLNTSASPAPLELQHTVESESSISQVISNSPPLLSEYKGESGVVESIEESPKKLLSTFKEEFDINIGTNSQLVKLNNSVAAVFESLTPQETDACDNTSCTPEEIAINSSVIVDESAASKCSSLDEKTKESSEIKLIVESSDISLPKLLVDTVESEISINSLKEESTKSLELITQIEAKETVDGKSDLLQTASSSQILVEDSAFVVGSQDSNIDDTRNQETLKVSSLSDFKNNADDLINDSPANVSISKELTVTITDDLRETVISDLLAKAENCTSSESQDFLNGPGEEINITVNGNIKSECSEVVESKLDCPEAISPLNKECDQVLATESNLSANKEVQSPDNALNLQTSCVEAANDKLDTSSVQTIPDRSLDVEEFELINSITPSKEITDHKLIGEEGTEALHTETLKNKVDESICKQPVDNCIPTTTLEFVEKSSEILNKYQETEKDLQNTTTIDVPELLPKLDKIETAQETDEIVPINIDTELNGNIVASPGLDTELNGNIVPSGLDTELNANIVASPGLDTELNANIVPSPSLDRELNANIVKSESYSPSPVDDTTHQESSGVANNEFVSVKSELNASSASLDESLPLLDAIDESFEARTEDKLESFYLGLKSSQKDRCPEQENKIVSTKFCVANLNKSDSYEPIKESVLLDNTSAHESKTGVEEPVENCVNQASLEAPNTPVDDLKNNNCPVVISEDSAPKSIGTYSPNSAYTTQKDKETFHGINAITKNVNESFSKKLDHVLVQQSIEAPTVDELNKESAELEKEILEEAFNKLSIEIRDDLLKENSPLKVEASKSPKNPFPVSNTGLNDNSSLNPVVSPIASDANQLIEDYFCQPIQPVVEVESKSECVSENSKIIPIELLEPNCENSEKNENIKELKFDDSLTEEALNLSREILLNSEEQTSDNFTVEMDNKMSSPTNSVGQNRVSFECNGLGNNGGQVDLDRTIEKQSESLAFDSTTNSSEAGPITAEEFSIPASDFQFDFDSLPCGVTNPRLAGAKLLTRNSLYVKFDPIVGKILANTENSSVHFLSPQTSERLQESSLERTPMKNPTFDEKLISLTPCRNSSASNSPVNSGDANSSVTEQLDCSIDSVSNKSIVNANLNKTDPDITVCVKNLSYEAESNQSSSNSTPQATKHQAPKSTPRGTVVSQENYLKEVEKLQDLMSKQEQSYQEELNRTTEKMEKLQLELSTLKKEMHSKAKASSQSDVVLCEYERTISQLVAQNEADKKEFELVKEKLIQERDTVTIHLNNTEIAFNDVHQKYERSKVLIEGMKHTQDTLKASNQEYEKLLKAQEDKYNKLRTHVAGQLENANQEMEAMVRSHQAENERLKARLKQAEIANKSLENSNEHKSKEIKELTQILDELIGKVGPDGV